MQRSKADSVYRHPFTITPIQHRHAVPRSRAFTLIELLVVISIIVLLIAILMPALGKARQAGQSVSCLSNQRQIGISSVMYHADYKEYLIPIYRQGSTPHRTWRGFLIPYMNDESMNAFRCPSKGTPGASVDIDNPRGVAPHSYGLNRWNEIHYMEGGSAAARSGHRTSVVRRPTETIYVGDLGLPSNPLDKPEDWRGDNGVASWGYMRMPGDSLYHHTLDPWNLYPRHLRNVNVLFYDGHASSKNVTNDIAPYLPGNPNCIYDNE